MARITGLPGILTPEMRAKAEQMKRARGLEHLGFYEDLMVHPALLERVEALGAFLRFHGLLPGRVREAAILCAGVFLRSALEWTTHQQTARAAGLTEAEISAIGIRASLPPDLESVRNCVEVVLQGRKVPQPLFDALARTYSLPAAVELVTLAAFYRMAAALGSAMESPTAGELPWESKES